MARQHDVEVERLDRLDLLRQTVEIDSLIDELWDEAPPRSAITTVRTHIYHLRGMLTKMIGERRTEAPVGNRSPGTSELSRMSTSTCR